MSLETQFQKEMGSQEPIEMSPMIQVDPATGAIEETSLEVSNVKLPTGEVDFEALEEAEEVSTVPLYWSTETKGQTSIGYYLGAVTFQKNRNGEKIELEGYSWFSKNGVFFVGGAVARDRFASIPINAPIKIEYLGKKPTKDKKNEYKDYEVKLLRVKK